MTAVVPPAWVLELDLSEQPLLLREHDSDRWWRIHPDGTRTLIGAQPDVEALVRSWLHWDADGHYVGTRYTVARVDPAVLDHWPDASPAREFR